MNIERALAIQGWMESKELLWLAEQASKHESIVEIGCWKGRSTRALADNTSGQVWAVDTWLGSVEHNPPVQGLCEEFKDNLKDHLQRNGWYSSKVIMIQEPSVQAAERLRNGGWVFDMAFIDASHDYENIKADIAAWTPLVCKGGIICGHDRGYPPIHQAVHEAFPGKVGGETDIWCVQL